MISFLHLKRLHLSLPSSRRRVARARQRLRAAALRGARAPHARGRLRGAAAQRLSAHAPRGRRGALRQRAWGPKTRRNRRRSVGKRAENGAKTMEIHGKPAVFRRFSSFFRRLWPKRALEKPFQEWGHDFREAYSLIGGFAKRLKLPIQAFTATANAKTQRDVVKQLQLESPMCP